MADVEWVLELPLGPEQAVAEDPVAAFPARAADAGQHQTVVVDQFGAGYGWRAQQAEDQLLRQFGVDVVGNARSGVVADFQQRTNLAVDGGLFTGIIDGHLGDAQQRAKDKCHQHGQAGLFE